MTYKQICESLPQSRKDQMAVMKLAGGTKFQVTGIEHDRESDLYCLLIGSMPEDTEEAKAETVKTDNQISLDDLLKEMNI